MNGSNVSYQRSPYTRSAQGNPANGQPRRSAPQNSGQAGGQKPPQKKKQKVIRLIDVIRFVLLFFLLALVLLLFSLCGRRGEQGPMGLQGEQGIQGEKGEKGDKGDTGEQGPQGLRGFTGATGLTGEKGEKGDKGDTGAQGIQGEKGEKGDTGATGAPGKDGRDGVDGAAGVGVQYVYLDENKNVIVVLTNGSTFNAGAVVDDVPSTDMAFTYLYGSLGVSGIGECRDTEIVIPDNYLGYVVDEIMENAFANSTTLTSVKIPKTASMRIRQNAFAFCESLTSVTLPVTTNLMGVVHEGGCSPFSGCSSIEAFVIEGVLPENMPYWCSTDAQGALYFHISTTVGVNKYLVAYPAGRTAKTYELPADVVGVVAGALMGASHLEHISVAEGNLNYHSVDGVLYGVEGSAMTLVAYPSAKADREYTIASEVDGAPVTVLMSEAFYGTRNLKKVTVSKELRTIRRSYEKVALLERASVTEFAVEEGNVFFVAIGGTLYEKVPGKPGVIPVQ